mgnify:CR=1 FL=1
MDAELIIGSEFVAKTLACSMLAVSLTSGCISRFPPRNENAVKVLADAYWLPKNPEERRTIQTCFPTDIRKLGSKALSSRLPGRDVYRAWVYDWKRLKGHRLWSNRYSIVFDGSLPAYIDSDASATTVLSQAKKPIVDAHDVLRAVKAFCDLRGYHLLFAEHYGSLLKHKAVNYQAEDPVWHMLVRKEPPKWIVECSVSEDPPGFSTFTRYQFSMTTNGVVTVDSTSPLLKVAVYR